jgi:hypothetical protein
MKTKASLYTLILLLGLLAVGAIFGGGALIISPSGELLKMPLSNLGASPFKDFLIPGIILISILGIVPGFLIFALLKQPKCKICESLNFFKDMHWAWSFCVYVAFALVIWIHVEVIFLHTVIWVHTFYIIFALIMLFITLLPPIRKLYKKDDTI